MSSEIECYKNVRLTSDNSQMLLRKNFARHYFHNSIAITRNFFDILFLLCSYKIAIVKYNDYRTAYLLKTALN